MGRALAEASAAARDVYALADAALGDPISRLCFEGPLDELTLTRNTQPALLATSAAIVASMRETWPRLVTPAAALGHSLGEYGALVAAGALETADAVRLVRARGTAMQEAVPPGEGSMAAILNVEPETLRLVCEEASAEGLVSPANFNAPGQIVVAGTKAGVDKAVALVSARGGKAIPLKVSAPFHCALMKPAAERLRAELARIEVVAPRFPVIANVDAEPNVDPARVKELLVAQVDAPVQWVRSIQRAVAMGVTTMLEIGPSRVLAGLVKRIDKSVRVIGVSDPASIAALEPEITGAEEK
jgi:[acyl-carrier-protein] S-malonyltransferase